MRGLLTVRARDWFLHLAAQPLSPKILEQLRQIVRADDLDTHQRQDYSSLFVP